jgi:hypothetical protein
MIKQGSYELQAIRKNSKIEWWIQALIMWKKPKIRGMKENMKRFKSSHPILTFKPFNRGIIQLQQEFKEAVADPSEYLLNEGIKQMAKQHLSLRLDGRDLPISKKMCKVKIPISFSF